MAECYFIFIFIISMDAYTMVKTLIICLFNRTLFFATFEKVRPGDERKLRNKLYKSEWKLLIPCYIYIYIYDICIYIYMIYVCIYIYDICMYIYI